MKLLGISGTIVGTKTSILVQQVLEKVKQLHPEMEVEYLDLKEYSIDFCDGRDPSQYTGDTKKVIDIITSADCFIIGTPIFQGSIPGALKNIFDLVPMSAFRQKVVGFIANGGTFQHYLVVENQLKPIAGYFRSYIAPGVVYAQESHFNDQREIIDDDLEQRISNLAEEVVYMHQSLAEK